MTKHDAHSWKLNRTIDIAAPVSLVYEMLTTTAHWAQWWGEGARIEARQGGRVRSAGATRGLGRGDRP